MVLVISFILVRKYLLVYVVFVITVYPTVPFCKWWTVKKKKPIEVENPFNKLETTGMRLMEINFIVHVCADMMEYRTGNFKYPVWKQATTQRPRHCYQLKENQSIFSTSSQTFCPTFNSFTQLFPKKAEQAFIRKETWSRQPLDDHTRSQS